MKKEIKSAMEQKPYDIIEGVNFPANNRYLIFAGKNRYPNGGFYDLVNQTNLLTDAIEIIYEVFREYEWCQIVDIYKNKIIFSSENEDDFKMKIINAIEEQIIKRITKL